MRGCPTLDNIVVPVDVYLISNFSVELLRFLLLQVHPVLDLQVSLLKPQVIVLGLLKRLEPPCQWVHKGHFRVRDIFWVFLSCGQGINQENFLAWVDYWCLLQECLPRWSLFALKDGRLMPALCFHFRVLRLNVVHHSLPLLRL